jgi:hypothetical protein
MSLKEKKALKRAQFDAAYDGEQDPEDYFDELKADASKQAAFNKAEFADMDEETRVKYEGFRPGR